LFTIKTASALLSGGLFNIVLPNDFPISAGSSQCAISGPSLNSMTNCLYFSTNNTIQAGGLNTTTQNISAMTVTLNISMSMSQNVGTYSFTVSSQSLGGIVDIGYASLTTTSRKLTSSQFYVTSSSSFTYSATVYTLYFSLPFNSGATYSVTVTFPFDVQGNQTLLLNGANFISFSSQLLTFTSNQLTNNASVTINNMMTSSSLQPTTISVNITYQNIVYFYGSFQLATNKIKQFNYVNVVQSNQVVYSPAIATISLDNLVNGDKVVLTASYSYFYPNSQPNCSSIISCGTSGSLSLLNVNASGVTSFNVNIQNLGYVGQAQLNITTYDSMQIYAKQSSIVNLTVTTTNAISIIANQTNPYLNELSTYSFNLQFTTPNASSLLVTPPSGLLISSVSCLLNCGTSTKLTIGYLFSVSSTNCIITITLTNPTAFSSSNIFVFKTSNSFGDMDYGQYVPQAVCNAPCRSCSNQNMSLCLTCYSWSSLTILNNNTCVSTCSSGYYQAIGSGNISICSACSPFCINCNGAANNCSTCLSTAYYFN
jgi:hypothetical protein